ncbi:hypothetical protein CYLTODRAFT_484660 [Cylindrobasidium torrendii FP15055 ss-10]|uniref:Stealth protein CR3 conserved region 3 domain-containing protein n=1 Tax=Cylindrobasidium torrendii FP15055 ss-10 TaxID=1314674 RepID=A0A0D7BXH6_9AGAR|nr:hypothetical protein CYLTODRAFT_484660 [Cylindrobasidium torrendii FP15055 ss-10]
MRRNSSWSSCGRRFSQTLRRPILIIALLLSLVIAVHVLWDYPILFSSTKVAEQENILPVQPAEHDPSVAPNIETVPQQGPSVAPELPLPEAPANYSVVGDKLLRNDVLYDPFPRPVKDDFLKDLTIHPIRAQADISYECWDYWISNGVWDGPCSNQRAEESVIDVVWTWVNGSDPLQETTRNHFADVSGFEPQAARYREHDELRFSLRSVARATAGWKNSTWRIISPDIQDPEHPERHLGLLPQWLDASVSLARRESRPAIDFIHDSQLFRYSSLVEPTEEDIEQWRNRALPAFNSHSIEAQLPNLDPRRVSENIIVLNDDYYLRLPLPPSAFHTPLYGPVFRIDPSQAFNGDNAGLARGEHEALSLRWSAKVLSDRFGTRARSYISHNTRAFSLPLMHEASLAFADNYHFTTFSRFRGQHKKPKQFEMNTIFTTTHYTMERHREALLWSYIVGKWGGPEGVITPNKAAAMWAEMGGSDDVERLKVPQVEDMSGGGQDVIKNIAAAGLETPQSDSPQTRAHVDYIWTSHDGFPVHLDGTRPPWHMQKIRCFRNREERAWDVFRRAAKDDVKCGDAIITLIKKNQPSMGLGVFLPPASPSPSNARLNPLTLPLKVQIDPPPFPADPRAFAVSLLQRYAYAVGTASSQFIKLTVPWAARKDIELAQKVDDLVFLCINDDIPDVASVMKETTKIYTEFIQGMFPEPLDIEREDRRGHPVTHPTTISATQFDTTTVL